MDFLLKKPDNLKPLYRWLKYRKKDPVQSYFYAFACQHNVPNNYFTDNHVKPYHTPSYHDLRDIAIC